MFRFDWQLYWVEAVADEELLQYTNREKHGRYTVKFLGTSGSSSFRLWLTPAILFYDMTQQNSASAGESDTGPHILRTL